MIGTNRQFFAAHSGGPLKAIGGACAGRRVSSLPSFADVAPGSVEKVQQSIYGNQQQHPEHAGASGYEQQTPTEHLHGDLMCM